MRSQDPDRYAAWINERLGAEVRARREALGISAYTMGKCVGGACDQTILNIEQGALKNGPNTKTLARICVRLGITVAELFAAAERRP